MIESEVTPRALSTTVEIASYLASKTAERQQDRPPGQVRRVRESIKTLTDHTILVINQIQIHRIEAYL